jgi:hypothetical protein
MKRMENSLDCKFYNISTKIEIDKIETKLIYSGTCKF